MGQQLVQAGDFNCASGGVVGKASLYIHVPLTIDCPMSTRLYEKFDINGEHASHGDIDPMAFSGNTAEGAVINGYKTSNQQSEGVEVSQTLVIKKGGDNSFIRRYEALCDDIGQNGGAILNEMILEWVSQVDGLNVNAAKSRFYKVAADSGDIPNTENKADTSEYSIELKVNGRPLVLVDTPDALLQDTTLSLSVTDTLAYDDATKIVSGIITVDEFAGSESTIDISLIDPLDRSPYMTFGTYVSATSETGEFEIEVEAPVAADSTEIQVSAVTAGVILLQKSFPISAAPMVFGEVTDTTPNSAKANIELKDIKKLITGKQLNYKVFERITNKLVDSGSSTNLKNIDIKNLKQNKDYVLKVLYNNREMFSENFRTTKDLEAPAITVLSNVIETKVGGDVSKKAHINSNGLSVVDDVDGDITDTAHVTVSEIDTSKKGSYTQVIRAVDNAGNEALKEIEIIVK